MGKAGVDWKGMKAVLGWGVLDQGCSRGPRLFPRGPRAFFTTTAKPGIREHRFSTPQFPIVTDIGPLGEFAVHL